VSLADTTKAYKNNSHAVRGRRQVGPVMQLTWQETACVRVLEAHLPLPRNGTASRSRSVNNKTSEMNLVAPLTCCALICTSSFAGFQRKSPSESRSQTCWKDGDIKNAARTSGNVQQLSIELSTAKAQLGSSH
jgi:hypothetical protein